MRLLIFKVNQLGDNLVFLPTAQWLEKLLPDSEIAIFTSPLAAPLYERCLPRAQVVTVPTAQFNGAWKNPIALLRLRRLARDFAPDACLVAHDQGSVAHLLAWMSGAKIRVGSHFSRCRLRKLLSHRVALDPAGPVAAQNWRLAAALLKILGRDRTAMPEEPPLPDIEPFTSTRRIESPFVLIHPGSSRAYQRWPLERYVELANRLVSQIQVRFMLQDDPAEEKLDARVQRVASGTLASLFEIMSQAAFFIGNNSGPMHVASVCGVPGLVFAGPAAANWNPMWHGNRFTLLRVAELACQPCDKPSGPVNRCLNAADPMACMNRISVDEAHRAVCRKLGLV